jgi:hypothetical protein
MLQPTDLVQLPKGQAFALIEGGQLVKLRLPLPSDESDKYWPASMEAVFTGMQAKYQSYLHQAEAQDVPVNFEGGTASKLTTEGVGSGF